MIRLNDDRTITVTLDDGAEIVLRPPSIGEWRKIRDAYLSAEAANVVWLNERRAEYAIAKAAWDALPDDDFTHPPAAPHSEGFIWGDANPFGTAFALVVSELATPPLAALDADRLPMWANDPTVYVTLSEHWRTIRVDRTNEPPAEPVFDPVAAGLTSPADTPRTLPKSLHGALTQGAT